MTVKKLFHLAQTAFVWCFIMIALLACGPAKPGIYKGDEIPSGVKNKLRNLNTELLSALKANDPERQELLMNQELINDKGNRLRIAEHISNRMKLGDYSLLADYYIVNQVIKREDSDNAEFSGTNLIKERGLGINNFDLSIYRQAEEMYMALFIPKKASEQWLVSAIYSKYDYGWKISRLELSPYAENGRTAPELMKQAKEQLKNGYWLDASNTASYAVNCGLE
jgi:hypothetical protein